MEADTVTEMTTLTSPLLPFKASRAHHAHARARDTTPHTEAVIPVTEEDASAAGQADGDNAPLERPSNKRKPRRRMVTSGPRYELACALARVMTLPTWEYAKSKGLTYREWRDVVVRPALWLLGIYHAAYKHGWESKEFKAAWDMHTDWWIERPTCLA
jgi:hypothetical protein